MAIRVILAGATGWAGSELARAIASTDDLALVAAVSRTHAGRRLGDALTNPALTAPVYATARGAHVVIGTSGLGDDDYREALTQHGFEVVRSSLTMEIDLETPTERPVWPSGLTSRPFRPGEERAVYDAYVEAFADHWGFIPESFADWCTWNLGPNRDTSLWRVVDAGAEIAALCVNVPSRGDDRTLGWVALLAVRREWRRRGLARALLLESFGLFRSIGRRRAALGVDSENTTGALALYEGVGMRATSRSDTWERAV